MKKFFKLVLANMVAYLLLTIIGIFFLIGMVASLSLSGEETVVVKDKSILEITLDYDMPDRAMSAFPMFDGKTTVGLNAALEALSNAKTDDKIKGIFLNLTSASDVSLAALQELRHALDTFKTSKKFILAYSDHYSQSAYYLGSVADKVYLNPEGQLDFRGLSSQLYFLKGTFEKLGVDMQVVRHGKYKSAIEPFVNDKMSPENREQTQKYLNGLWHSMVSEIAKSRKLSVSELNRVADGMLATEPEKAQALKLIDGLLNPNEMLQTLAKSVKEDDIEKLELVDLKKYTKVDAKATKTGKDKIAVIYAQGEIGMGKGDGYSIGSETLSKAIRKAANDDKIKAIVLRVNSPGGDALASDIILQEIIMAKTKKPVVASFGQFAASGGYYIACAANCIYADKTTLTGSIGVFGVIPNAKKLLNDKIGVTFDEVSTNTNSNFLSVTRPMTSFEQMKMQSMIERIYNTFITHVANGRNLTKSYVDSIGQGRVWCGFDAKEIGLIDEFGGLNEALAKAAELAKLANYKVVNFPKEKDPFEQFMEMFGGVKANMVKAEMGEWYSMYEFCKSFSEKPAVWARLPYLEEIK